MVEFKLVDYVRDINSIAKENNCAADKALQLFLANLAVMNDKFKGASHLNFRALGQQWNALSSDERNAQKAEVRLRMTRTTRGGSIE